ncbi:trigger factor [Dehalococcoidia bacterium]|nr:trigger factor [Dehalococcoidia bacterium]
MKVSTERIPDSQIVLNIEVDDDEFEVHKNRAYKKIVQQANVPGFRKGKAPRRVLEQVLKPGTLVDEALETLVPEFTAKAIESEGIEAVGQPTVEIEQETPLIVKATVPLKPTVDLGDYQSVRVTWDESHVTEDEITEVLENMQRDTTPWEPVDRPIEMGDMVTLKLEAWGTGLPPLDQDENTLSNEESSADSDEDKDDNGTEERQFMNEDDWTYYPRPESEFPAPGFSDAIIGMSQDEEREFNITIPEDHSIEDLAGKETRYKVTLKDIKGQDLAPMDDEWAKGVGEGHESFDALKSSVTEDLSSRKEEEVKQNYESEVLKQVIEGANLEFAPIMVNQEIEHLLRSQAERLRSMGMELENYLSMSGTTIEDMVEQMRPDAESRVTNSLILGQVIEENSIEATEEEIQTELKRVTGLDENATPEQQEQMNQLMESEEARTSVQQSIAQRKAMDSLVKIARDDNTDIDETKEGEDTNSSSEDSKQTDE